MAKTDEDAENAIALLALVAMVPLMLLQGWALSLLWAWFVVPLGAPAIGIVHGYGLMLVVTLCSQPGMKPESLARWLSQAAARPLLFVAVGWLFKTAAM